MNLGLGNLITLKRHLLAAPLAAGTGPVATAAIIRDDVLAAIGSGVAAQIEKFCGDRRFGYVSGDITEFSGDRLTYILPRYPVSALTAISTQGTRSDGFTTAVVNDQVADLDLDSGLIQFTTVQGNHWSRVRVTYSGGYWFDTTEDDTGTNTDSAPAMPADVTLAWLLQCQEVWNKRDKLGINLNAKPDDRVAISKLVLGEGIQELLRPFRRMQLS